MSIKTLGIFGLLLTLSVFMAIMTSHPWYDILNGTFLQPNNIENLLRRTSMYGLLGIGVAFVIITGGTGNPYFTTDTAAALRATAGPCAAQRRRAGAPGRRARLAGAAA